MNARRLVIFTCLMLFTLPERSIGDEISDKPVPSGIRVLGWEETTRRIWYLVSTPFGRRASADTIQQLRYYETGDSTDQQPHSAGSALFGPLDSIPGREDVLKEVEPGRREFQSRLNTLVATLKLMPPVRALPPIAAVATHPHDVSYDDYSLEEHDYRVTYRGLSGAWESYEVCETPMKLGVRRIHLTPDRKDGLAILYEPACGFAVVMLISTRKVAVLRFEWSQTP